MEFAAGGDVLKKNQNHLKKGTKYKEEEIWTALVQMANGLKSLHDKKILHRDLKCANVFITSDNIYKLGDLNVSKVLKKILPAPRPALLTMLALKFGKINLMVSKVICGPLAVFFMK